MSYNLTASVPRTKSFSKYLLSNIDQFEDFYLFSMQFVTAKKKFKKFKKIKNSKSDNLIDLSDNININKYFKMELGIVSLNNTHVDHYVNVVLDKDNNIYQDDVIYLEFNIENDMLKCYYNLSKDYINLINSDYISE